MRRMPACVHRQRCGSASRRRASQNHPHARHARRTRRSHRQQSRPARVPCLAHTRVPRAPHSPHRGAAKLSSATQRAHRAARPSLPVDRPPATSIQLPGRYWHWQHSLVSARDSPHCCRRPPDQQPSPLARKFCWQSLPAQNCRPAKAPHRQRHFGLPRLALSLVIQCPKPAGWQRPPRNALDSASWKNLPRPVTFAPWCY